jgi:integrase
VRAEVKTVRPHLRKYGGSWVVRYDAGAGSVEQSLKVTSLTDAFEKLGKLESLQGESDNPTFAEFLDEFRMNFGNWSERTWRGNAGTLKKLRGEFGGEQLRHIRPRQIQRYLMRRRKEDGITEATANRYLATLKVMFGAAKLWDYLDESPTDGIKMLKEQSKIPHALSEDELERLIENCPGLVRDVVIVAVDTGLRRSELQRLRWDDVDFEHRMLTVKQSKNRKFRVIPMTERVVELLLRRRNECADDDRVLPFVDVGRSLKTAAKRASIAHVHLHCLRHTFASLLRDRGVPIDRIMELLGHSSLGMSLRYAHARPQQLFEAIHALETRPTSPTGRQSSPTPLQCSSLS